MRVIAVDPGKATGIACRDTVTDELWTLTVDEWEAEPELIKRQGRLDILHVEEFRVNSKTAKKSPAPWSLKLYGALEVLAKEEGWSFSHLPASVAKSAVRSVKGVPCKMTSPHARDAMRHLVVVLATRGDEWAKQILREGLT